MNKQGITLSVNMVVVIVLGIVLIGVGLFLLQAIIQPLERINRDIDDNLKEELARSNFRGDKVIGLLNTHQSVKRGGEAWYLLGWVNEIDEERDFRVVTEYVEDSPVHDEFMASPYITEDGGHPDDIIRHLYKNDPNMKIALKTNEREFMWLPVFIPKNVPSGDYMYNVYVCVETDPSSPDFLYDDPCYQAGGNYQTYTGKKERMYIHVE